MANGIKKCCQQLGILRGGFLLPTLVQISRCLWEPILGSQLADSVWQKLLTLSAVPWRPGANMLSSRHPSWRQDHFEVHAANQKEFTLQLLSCHRRGSSCGVLAEENSVSWKHFGGFYIYEYLVFLFSRNSTLFGQTLDPHLRARHYSEWLNRIA